MERLGRRWVVALLATLQGLAGGCSWRGEGENPSYRRVLPPVAFEMLRDNPDILVLDLRTRTEFGGPLGHLKGAANIPLEELPFRLGELGGYRQRTFLVYCHQEGDCGREGMAILVSSGFRDAILMAGGVEAWIRYGFGTVKSGAPSPSEPPEPRSEPPR